MLSKIIFNVKYFFNHWLEILVEYRDAIIDDQPIGASGKPKAMNKNAQEIKDYVTPEQNDFYFYKRFRKPLKLVEPKREFFDNSITLTK